MLWTSADLESYCPITLVHPPKYLCYLDWLWGSIVNDLMQSGNYGPWRISHDNNRNHHLTIWCAMVICLDPRRDPGAWYTHQLSSPQSHCGWFFSTVHFHVFPQITWLRGGIVTLTAFPWLFFTVCGVYIIYQKPHSLYQDSVVYANYLLLSLIEDGNWSHVWNHNYKQSSRCGHYNTYINISWVPDNFECMYHFYLDCMKLWWWWWRWSSQTGCARVTGAVFCK